MNNNDFYIQKGGYLQFDAKTIDDYIKTALTNGDSPFTDQLYPGSNLSNFSEIISYVFNVLMYYLNQTSSESMFTEAQLYENMNRIVKLFGYNPIGYQTAILSYTATTTNLDEDTIYFIPRYAYFKIGSTTYTANREIYLKGGELESEINENILYQGKFVEYPEQIAVGEEHEIVFLTPGENIIVDHFNIDVYIKDRTGSWVQWKRVDSLINSNPDSKHFEARYNENGIYELKFGNDVNGKKLAQGDVIQIYYLKSDGENNEVGTGSINGVKYIQFNSQRFVEIYNDIFNVEYLGTLAPPGNVIFTNDVPSTSLSLPESVESIRENAPNLVKEKDTLVKVSDYERFIKRHFSNLVSDVIVVNNKQYADEYLKYFVTLGAKSIDDVSRIIYNQVNFSDSCNFNNVYAFVQPTIASNTSYNAYLSPALKQLIITKVEEYKSATADLIIVDPVYMAIDIGTTALGETPAPSDAENSYLLITKEKNSPISDNSIKEKIGDIFNTYFNQSNVKFGFFLSVEELANAIYAIEGVKAMSVKRTDINSEYNGLSLTVWNPVYTKDCDAVTRNMTFDYFKMPYLYKAEQIIRKIKIEVEI